MFSDKTVSKLPPHLLPPDTRNEGGSWTEFVPESFTESVKMAVSVATSRG